MTSSNDLALQKIMTFIDNHSDELSEGDYLEMCNKLRDIFRGEQRSRRVRTLPTSLRVNPMDVIYERCMVLVRKKRELRRALIYSKKRKRITQNFKNEAIKTYCIILGLDENMTLTDLQNEGHIPDESIFYKEFLRVTNEYREGLRYLQIQELDNIDNEMNRVIHFLSSTQNVVNEYNSINVNVPNLS